MTIRLIVNADDFGYFDGISAGILDAIAARCVTATGVMANGKAFDTSSEQLRAIPSVDVGVHLNATHGEPLTHELRKYLISGALPGKFALAARLTTGQIPITAITQEWRAQIQKCLAAGLEIRFLNSHEHVHMIPSLYSVIRALADEFGIRHVRYTSPELTLWPGISAILRSLLIAACNMLQPKPALEPKFLGLESSGRLNMTYIQRLLSRLDAGRVYELMCHPGRSDPVAATFPALRRYHDWTGELNCLLSTQFRETLATYSVSLVRFRDLEDK